MNICRKQVPPSPPEFPEKSSQFQIGSRVELRGIETRPELNQRQGCIESYFAPFDRYVVRLDEGPGIERTPLNIKPENLRLISEDDAD